MLTPYQEQLARAGRLYGRILRRSAPILPGREELDVDTPMLNYGDDVWSFFVNAWHVRDWIKQDPSIDAAAKHRMLAAAEAAPALRICADLANGHKHLILRDPRTSVGGQTMRAGWTDGDPMEWTLAVTIVLDDAGPPVDAVRVAWDVLRAWTSIIGAEGLAVPAGFPDLSEPPPEYEPKCR